MKTRNTKADLILLLVAAIWGFAFVAQRVGMDYLGPFGFNAARFLVGALSLAPLLWLIKNSNASANTGFLLKAGVMTGLLLFSGASLQQVGLIHTTAGNAGFITGLYIIFVPIIGLFFMQKNGTNTWLGAVLAVIGLYFLSVNEGFSINQGDIYELVGAVFWALHVIAIGYVAPKVDNLRLAIIQFVICGLLCLLVAISIERASLTLDNLTLSWLPIAYAGVMSVGVAYTLQIVAQKNASPSHAAIIMSLEALFAAIGGWLLLDEQLDSRATLGCSLMLTGMIIAQVRFKRRAKTQTGCPTQR
ncbi:DMT family transporter [Neptunomonas sp.]|uniref:DMT family transporter n=1 Tax=Neptunomonas TaxID=75687 RepID=UPI0035146B9F